MRPLTTNPEHREKERAFVRAVTKRDGWRCHAQRKWSWGWEKCDCRAQDVAHIFARSKEPAAKYDPRNGIKVCRPCHDAIDGRKSSHVDTDARRVPPDRVEQAEQAVRELSKVKVAR